MAIPYSWIIPQPITGWNEVQKPTLIPAQADNSVVPFTRQNLLGGQAGARLKPSPCLYQASSLPRAPSLIPSQDSHEEQTFNEPTA